MLLAVAAYAERASATPDAMPIFALFTLLRRA